jgi:hypothetical protein
MADVNNTESVPTITSLLSATISTYRAAEAGEGGDPIFIYGQIDHLSAALALSPAKSPADALAQAYGLVRDVSDAHDNRNNEDAVRQTLRQIDHRARSLIAYLEGVHGLSGRLLGLDHFLPDDEQ